MTDESRSERPRDWPDALIRLLERQERLIRQLADLVSQQADLIVNEQTDDLLELLAERQQIIERFTAAQDELGQLTDHLDVRLPEVDVARRERIERLIDAVGDQLDDVMAQDEIDQRKLQVAREGGARPGDAAFAHEAYLRAQNDLGDRVSGGHTG